MSLAPSANSLHAILVATRAACLLWSDDEDGCIASPGLGRLLGQEEDWTLWPAERCKSMVHRNDVGVLAVLVDALQCGDVGVTGQIRLRHVHGAWHRFDCRSELIGDGPMLVMTDITEKFQLEAAFLDSQTRLNSLYDSTPVSIILWSREGRITGWNAKAADTFGHTRDAVIGKKLVPTLIAPGDYNAFAANVSTAMADNKGADLVCDTLAADGGTLKCRWRTVPLRNRRGALVGLLSLAYDVTHELAAAESLARSRDEAERLNRLKSEFIAIVSHELRTPLNGILGVSQLLETLELDDEARPLVSTITDSGERLLKIVTGMVNFSQADLVGPGVAGRTFSLFEALYINVQGAEFQATAKGLAFSLSIDPDLPDEVVGDEPALAEIIRQLCDNAVRFTPAGSVSVALTALPAEAPGEARFALRVSDTGIGMSESFLKEMYAPFRQAEDALERHHEGVGLGLSMVRKMADRSAARIDVTSAPGEGTTFTVTFAMQSA